MDVPVFEYRQSPRPFDYIPLGVYTTVNHLHGPTLLLVCLTDTTVTPGFKRIIPHLHEHNEQQQTPVTKGLSLRGAIRLVGIQLQFLNSMPHSHEGIQQHLGLNVSQVCELSRCSMLESSCEHRIA
jgi:hypothetical protein